MTPEPQKKKHPVKHFIAGGIAGGVEATILYPTEFIKTQLQLQQSSQALHRPLFKGPLDCAAYIIKERGWLGLYNGLSTLVVGTFAKAAIRFYAYNKYATMLADDQGHLSSYGVLMAGLGAGMTESVLAVTPTETVKTKLIHDRNSPRPKYRGLFHGVTTIVRAEGFRGVYQGVVPTTLRQGANSAIRFTVYRRVQQFWKGNDPNAQVSTAKSFVSGAVAGIFATVLTMPIDVVKTRLQGQDASKYKGAFDCLVRIFREEGIFTLWKGAS